MKIVELISVNESYEEDANSILTDMVIRFYEMKKKKVPISYFSQQLSQRGIDLTDDQIAEMITDLDQVAGTTDKFVMFDGDETDKPRKVKKQNKEELNKERISKVAKSQAQKDLG